MPRTITANLKGRRFGRLKVIHETEQRGVNGSIVWECRCKCGEIVHVLTANLTSGNTQSCGCLQLERSRAANRKGGVRWRGTG